MLLVVLGWAITEVVDCSVVLACAVRGAWSGYPCFPHHRGLAVRLPWLVLFLSRRRPKGGKVWQRPKAADDPRVEEGLLLTGGGSRGRVG